MVDEYPPQLKLPPNEFVGLILKDHVPWTMVPFKGGGSLIFWLLSGGFGKVTPASRSEGLRPRLWLPVFAPVAVKDPLLNQTRFDLLDLCTDFAAYLGARLGSLAFFFC